MCTILPQMTLFSSVISPSVTTITLELFPAFPGHFTLKFQKLVTAFFACFIFTGLKKVRVCSKAQAAILSLGHCLCGVSQVFTR